MTADVAVRQAIGAHLKAEGISERALARRLGWGRMQVHRRLSGDAQITVADLHEIAEVLGVPVSRFLETSDGQDPATASETAADQADRSA